MFIWNLSTRYDSVWIKISFLFNIFSSSYILILQEYINDLRTKLNIFQQGNKNFLLFQKHFHKISDNKTSLENFLNKYKKYSKEIYFQQEFFQIYQKSSIQLRTNEQQRLLTIREQMKSIIHLTLLNKSEHLFISNNFDDLLNKWENEHMISLDHWLHYPHHSIKSQHDMSLILFDEIKQMIRLGDNLNEEFLQRIDSITSNLTRSHI